MASLKELKGWFIAVLVFGAAAYFMHHYAIYELRLLSVTLFVLVFFSTIKKALELEL
jgi:hypothetical protein